MKKITIPVLGILAVAAIVILAGCDGKQTSQNIQPSPPQSAPAENQNTQNAVTIKNFAFSPDTLTVKKGATVTWTNEDSAPHTIKSDTFNSGTLNTGDEFQFTFDTAGAFDYSCGIHPRMLGKIIVE